MNERTTLKVNHLSGNAYLQADDAQVTGLGLDLNLGRRYNSRLGGTGSFGPQWTLTGGPDVWLEKIDQWRYAYHGPDGAEFGPFVRNADTSADSDYRKFTRPVGGVGGELKDNNDGTFTLTFNQSQEKYVFTAMGSAGHLFQTKDTDRSGNAITYQYIAGTTRLASVTDTTGRSYQVAYNAAGLIDHFSDDNGPNTRTWSYGYTNGRLTSYTDPAGNQTTYDWATGFESTVPTLRTITDPVNDSGQPPTTVIQTYADEATDIRFMATASAQDAGYTVQYNTHPVAACDDDADQSALVDSYESQTAITTYCFTNRKTGDLDANANNAETAVIDGNGNHRSTSYSPDNQSETFTGGVPAAGSTVSTYGDPAAQLGDQLQSISDPADGSGSGTKTTFDYHADSSMPGHKYLPTSMVDGNGDCTAYAYDGTGRLTDTWIGRSPTSGRCDDTSGGYHYQAAYNSDGTVAWVADPNGGANPTDADKTLYTYWQPGDAGFVAGTRGQVKTVREPGGDCAAGTSRNLCTAYTYDGLSRTRSMTDGRGKVTTYAYDALDRTTQVLVDGATSCSYAAGTCVTYTYDGEGNLTQRVDAQGTTTFDYDRLNRQTAQNTPDGVQVGYGYNKDGQVATLQQTLPNQPTDTTQYFYDAASRLITVQDDAGQIGITHDQDNRLALTTFPSTPAVQVDRAYTKAGRPDSMHVRTGGIDSNGLADYDYTWTQDNNDTSQLQKLQVLNSSAAITYQSSYAYNSRGQLVSDTRTNGGGNSFTYTYDPAGNLSSKTTGGVTTNYGYDKAGQLCWKGNSTGTTPVTNCPVSAPGSNTLISRDAAGNSEGDPARPIQYNAYNQASKINGQDQSYNDLGNDLRVRTGNVKLVNTKFGITARTTPAGTTYYTRMPDGRLLASHGASGTSFYVTDYQKSIVAIIGPNGQRAGNYRYEPYGAPTIVESTAAAQDNPFRWHGGYYDIEGDGYYKFGARYYDADSHFTQPDPEMGSLGNPWDCAVKGVSGSTR